MNTQPKTPPLVIVLVVVACIFVGLIAVGWVQHELEQEASGSRSDDATASSLPITEEVAWDNLGQSECPTPGDRCWQIKVTPAVDCPRGLYVEVNLIDRDGNVVGSTNSTVDGLSAGQISILTFVVLDKRVSDTAVTETNCHR